MDLGSIIKQVDERSKLIKVHMVLRGLTFVQLAKDWDATPSLVVKVVAGKTQSSRIQNKFCQMFGLTYEELWPEDPRGFDKRVFEKVRSSKWRLCLN